MATTKVLFLLGIVLLTWSMIAESRDIGIGRSLLSDDEAMDDDVSSTLDSVGGAGSPDADPTSAGGGPDPATLATKFGATGAVDASGVKVFDVTKFGAVGDDKKDSVNAIRGAWIAACKGNAKAKVLIPKGTFRAGPILFAGPCTAPKPIIVEVQGTLKANTDLSLYTDPEWVTFENIDGLVVQGTGVFNGQGPVNWKYNDCKGKKSCAPLPANLRFFSVTNSVVKDITSLDSMYFHYHVHRCTNVTFTNIHITAPGNSPNTDGLHVSVSDRVNITNSVIATGDDCVSIGHSSTNIGVSGVTCGPGHGISIGSLGKRPDEASVSDITVRNCTFIKTTNGARIKTWIGTKPGEAKNIIYEHLIMQDVQNPVIIDQSYGGKKDRTPSTSVWKISNVHFRDIKGTTVSNLGVSLQCSSKNPCVGIEVTDVNLAFSGTSKEGPLASSCVNAKATFGGKLSPPACAA